MKNTSLLQQTHDPRIARRVSNISVSAIKEMTLLSSKVDDVISLGWGLPVFQTPSFIREELIKHLKDDPATGKYSLLIGRKELRNIIAKKTKEDTGFSLDPETEILITAGSMEGLHDVLLTIVERGDEVIVPSPCFSSHIEQIGLAEGVPIFVELNESRGWALDVELLEKKISSRTKAILITSPINPTGTVLSEQELRQIADIAIKHNLFIVTDETYNFLVYDGKKQFRMAQIHELKDLLITCYSLSKEFAMTGFRLGYVFGPKSIITQVLKVHDANVISAPTISQMAAEVALTSPRKEVERFVSIFSDCRDVTCARLDKLKDYFSYVKPQGAYYIFPRFTLPGITKSNDAAVRILNEAQVAVIPGSAFGPNGEGHIRISYIGDVDIINKAFDRIERWVKTL